jgi:HemY protein
MRYLASIKFFLQLILVCIFIVLVSMFPGKFQCEWLDYRISMPIGVLLSVILILFAFLNLLYRVWHNIWRIPEKYQRFLLKKKQAKGHQLLLDGLVAIAAGQPKEAQEFVELSRELIPDYPLTLFIAAQSSHIIGDQEAASQYFNRMAKDPRLMFLGLRGLIMQANERNDLKAASELLKQIYHLRPDSPWVIEEILRNNIMLSKIGIFYDLEKIGVNRYLDNEKWRRHQAVVLWLKAKNTAYTNIDQLEEIYKSIHNYAKDWTEPAIKLAEILRKNNNFNKAQKVIMASYEANPHRDLANIFINIMPHSNDIETYRMLVKLTESVSNHYESLIVLTKAALNAQLWGEAKNYLNKLLTLCETKEVCRLMAKLQADDNKEWIERAIDSSADYQWICTNCRSTHTSWDVICSHCDAVDTIKWQVTSTVKVVEPSNMVFHNDSICHISKTL